MPSEALAEAIRALVGEAVNVHAGPVAKLTAPAIVIRPAPSWFAQDRFCTFLERYSVICVAQASTPEEGVGVLRGLALAVINGLESPWDWESVEGPVIDQTTGVPFLANRINLTFRGGEES